MYALDEKKLSENYLYALRVYSSVSAGVYDIVLYTQLINQIIFTGQNNAVFLVPIDTVVVREEHDKLLYIIHRQ